MRTVLVIPGAKQPERLFEGTLFEWNGKPVLHVLLERQDEALDHGQTAVLADGAEAERDLPSFTEGFEFGSPELTPFVADEVTRSGP